MIKISAQSVHGKTRLTCLSTALKIGCLTLLSSGVVLAQTSEKKPANIKISDDKLSTPGVMEFVFSLALVLAAIFVVAWLLRRMGGFNASPGGVIRILGGMSVGSREKIVLVEVGKEQLLIGVAPGRVQTLHVLNEPVEIKRGQEGDNAFANRLKAVLKKEHSG
jgi:flagellar protein FliO/FliZ